MPTPGKLTRDKWGPFAPAHNSPVSGGPYYFRDTEALSIEWVTDLDAVAEILPSELFLDDPVVAFMVIENNHWSTLGSFGEVFLGVQCTWAGALHNYLVEGFSTSDAALIVNRELWGFGQKRAHRIDVITHDDGRVEAVMDLRPDDRAARAIMHLSQAEAQAEAQAKPAEAVSGPPQICLRIVPDVENDEPALAQLISIEYTNDPIVGSDGIAETYSGTGTLQFGGQFAAELPVKEYLSFTYGHANTQLSRGKVLKTY